MNLLELKEAQVASDIPEKNNMNNQRISLIFLLVALIISSCSTKIIPGLAASKQGNSYDEATYNYVFAEAVRQKLIGNGAEALGYFKKCIEINPAADAAYYQIAQILLNEGDNESAKQYIKRAININPGNYWYHVMLAAIYYQRQNRDSAIVWYENALKLNPEKENLQMNLANLYTENDQLTKARIILEKFDEKYGVNENTTVSLVHNMIKSGDFEKAYQKVEALLITEPDNLIYNGLLAGIYRRRGEKEKALNVYNLLIERNPNNPRILLSLCFFLVEEENYEELFGLTETVILDNEISREEKISLFGALAENDNLLQNYASRLEFNLMLLEATYKNDDIILLLRPGMMQKTGRLSDAAGVLEKIIEGSPDNYFAWERLLLIYYEMRDFKNILEKGEKVATRFNRSFLAKLLYATGASENEKYDIALEELRKAEILAGENRELQLQVLTMRADVYYRKRDYEKSFETFNEALKLDPEDLTVLNNYAYYLAEQGTRLKEAEGMARKVIERQGTNSTFLDTYAWVLYKRRKTRQAAKIMEKIISSGEEDNAEWYEHYGFILKKMGRCNEAVIKWQRAMELDEKKQKLRKEIENCLRKH